MEHDVRKRLASNAERRADLSRDLHAAEAEEHKLIARAWREHIPPAEIAKLAGRSAAHIRKLRPDDVPPLRLGGGAAAKRRRRKP